ncbi:MAG TPA: hypothetical protein VK576_03480 [Thermoleophilia bacterium]|nr:hypothetical protein [Thermoleophilia bacterium]
MAVVNWVVVIAGLVGLGVAGYGLVTLIRHALRTHSYLDIVLAGVVVVLVVAALIAFGDRLLR